MNISPTGLYAAVLALLAIGLAYRVVSLRRKHKVGLGSGGHDELDRAIRAHANHMEYSPLALLLLFILETGGANSVLLHGLGISLTTGRVLHAWGLSSAGGISFGRFYGTALTWLCIVVSALLLLLRPFIG